MFVYINNPVCFFSHQLLLNDVEFASAKKRMSVEFWAHAIAFMADDDDDDNTLVDKR